MRIALEAQGIEVVLFDQTSLGFDGYAGRVRLMIQKDADFERARAVVQEIEATALKSPVEGWRIQRWGCLAVALGLFSLPLGGSAIADLSTGSELPPLIAYGLVGGALSMMAAGLALILFGPRWSRRPPQS